MTRRATDRERVNSRGSVSRHSILIAGERLFAERGIATVPLRDIGAAAGQKNHTAVQYHFGSRDGLVHAISSYRASATEQIRAETVAEMLTTVRQPQVSDIVRAYIFPLAIHLEDGNHYLAFMSRYIIEHGGYAGMGGVASTHTIMTFKSMLGRLLPELSEDVLNERWMMLLTSTIHTLARYQAAMKLGTLSAPVEGLLDDLVEFLTAGIQAGVAQVRQDRASDKNGQGD